VLHCGRLHVQLNVRGVEPPRSKPAAYGAIDRKLFENGAKVNVYSHVLQYQDTGDYAVQYWFLYLFNYRLNEHESDWSRSRSCSTRIRTHRGALLVACHRLHPNWSDMEHDGDHPIVYAARGSHANYFHAGSHPVTLFCPKLFKRFSFCVEKRTFAT